MGMSSETRYVSVEEFTEYCGISNVEELTEDASDADAYLKDIISEAEGDVESKCGLVYKLPLPVNNTLIQKWTKIIARAELWERNAHNDIPTKFKSALTVAYAEMAGLGAVPPTRFIDGAELVGSAEGGSSILISSNEPIFNDFNY